MYTTMEPCSIRLSGNLPCCQSILSTLRRPEPSSGSKAGAGVGVRITRVYVGAMEPENFVQCEGMRLYPDHACMGPSTHYNTACDHCTDTCLVSSVSSSAKVTALIEYCVGGSQRILFEHDHCAERRLSILRVHHHGFFVPRLARKRSIVRCLRSTCRSLTFRLPVCNLTFRRAVAPGRGRLRFHGRRWGTGARYVVKGAVCVCLCGCVCGWSRHVCVWLGGGGGGRWGWGDYMDARRGNW